MCFLLPHDQAVQGLEANGGINLPPQDQSDTSCNLVLLLLLAGLPVGPGGRLLLLHLVQVVFSLGADWLGLACHIVVLFL